MNNKKHDMQNIVLSIGLITLVFALSLNLGANKAAMITTSATGLEKITGMQTAEQEQPEWVPPHPRQFGGETGDVQTITIDEVKYHIRINMHFVGDGEEGRDGYIYPINMVMRFDTNYDGVLSPEELDEGTRYEGCPLCVAAAEKYLEDYPNGIQALPLEEATKRIANERWLEDSKGELILFYAQGEEPLEDPKAWMDAGFENPIEAKQWSYDFENPRDAIPWRDASFTAVEASFLLTAGVSSNDIIEGGRYSGKSYDAIENLIEEQLSNAGLATGVFEVRRDYIANSEAIDGLTTPGQSYNSDLIGWRRGIDDRLYYRYVSAENFNLWKLGGWDENIYIVGEDGSITPVHVMWSGPVIPIPIGWISEDGSRTFDLLGNEPQPQIELEIDIPADSTLYRAGSVEFYVFNGNVYSKEGVLLQGFEFGPDPDNPDNNILTVFNLEGTSSTTYSVTDSGLTYQDAQQQPPIEIPPGSQLYTVGDFEFYVVNGKVYSKEGELLSYYQFTDTKKLVWITDPRGISMLEATDTGFTYEEFEPWRIAGFTPEQVQILNGLPTPISSPDEARQFIDAANSYYDRNVAQPEYIEAFEEYLSALGKSEEEIEAIMADPIQIAYYQQQLGVDTDGQIGQGTSDAADAERTRLIEQREVSEAQIEQWEEAGFSREDMTAWNAAGFDLELAKILREYDISPSEAGAEFNLMSFADVDKLIREAQNVFTPEEFVLWRSNGFNFEEVKYWKEADFVLGDAIPWRDAGFTPEQAQSLDGLDIAVEEAEEMFPLTMSYGDVDRLIEELSENINALNPGESDIFYGRQWMRGTDGELYYNSAPDEAKLWKWVGDDNTYVEEDGSFIQVEFSFSTLSWVSIDGTRTFDILGKELGVPQPSPFEDALQEAEDMIVSNNDEAIRRLNLLLEQNPEHEVKIQTALGRAYLEREDFVKAKESFQAALVANPDAVVPRIFLDGMDQFGENKDKILEYVMEELENQFLGEQPPPPPPPTEGITIEEDFTITEDVGDLKAGETYTRVTIDGDVYYIDKDNNYFNSGGERIGTVVYVDPVKKEIIYVNMNGKPYHVLPGQEDSGGVRIRMTADYAGNMYFKMEDGKYYKVKDGEKSEASSWDYNSVRWGVALDKAVYLTAGYDGMSFFYDEPNYWIDLDERMMNILGGIDGWTSEVCKDPSLGVSSPGNIGVSTSRTGAYAHIEGEKIKVINYSSQSKPFYYLYKISYQVSPGSEMTGCDIKFNVKIDEKEIFLEDYFVKKGGTTIDRGGNNMIVDDSLTNYDKVCLVFKDIRADCMVGIESGDTLCKTIVDGGAKEIDFGEDPCKKFAFWVPTCWLKMPEPTAPEGAQQGEVVDPPRTDFT